MRLSPLSNLPVKTEPNHPIDQDSATTPPKKAPTHDIAVPLYVNIAVWICRLIVGATFIASGLAKTIDLWGFIYKIEQYLSVWGLQIPGGIVFTVATTLATAEFLLGFLLLTGSYKRTCAWLIGVFMAVMLPLTLYIAIANPVADCGCFGDMWVISNTLTFVKNIILTILAIYLILNNAKTNGLFTTYSQWLVAVLAIIYILIIAIFGYNVQPLIDFRPYPTGCNLGAMIDADDNYTPSYTFIYEKAGVEHEFTEDSLPDDSWTFVSRKEIDDDTNSSGEGATMFTLYDENGDDVTSDAILNDGEEILLLIPDLRNTDVSTTYLINEISRHISSRGGIMAAIIATDSDGVNMWRDLSMASYPIYTSEDTSIKELARGNIAVIYIDGFSELADLIFRGI